MEILKLEHWLQPYSLLTVFIVLVTVAIFLYSGWVVEPEDFQKQQKLRKDKGGE